MKASQQQHIPERNTGWWYCQDQRMGSPMNHSRNAISYPKWIAKNESSPYCGIWTVLLSGVRVGIDAKCFSCKTKQKKAKTRIQKTTTQAFKADFVSNVGGSLMLQLSIPWRLSLYEARESYTGASCAEDMSSCATDSGKPLICPSKASTISILQAGSSPHLFWYRSHLKYFLLKAAVLAETLMLVLLQQTHGTPQNS